MWGVAEKHNAEKPWWAEEGADHLLAIDIIGLQLEQCVMYNIALCLTVLILMI